MDRTNLSSKSSHGVIPLGTKAANENSSSEIGSLDEQLFNGELDLEPSIFKFGMPLEDDVVVRAAGSYIYCTQHPENLCWIGHQIRCPASLAIVIQTLPRPFRIMLRI